MEIESLKQRLLAKEGELEGRIARIKGEASVLREAEVGDAVDAAASSQAVAESLEEEALALQTLAHVKDALQRVAAGAYGTCVDCGRPIENIRLQTIPWATYCLEDQEKHDQATQIQQGGSTL
jgi:DnaK suppressor protein